MLEHSIHATAEEAAKPLPGDGLVAAQLGVFTHAVTIPAPPEQVWPWLAQMGAGTRAGWYSYDRLDNGGKRSAWRIIPELQHVAVGDLFPALPGAQDAFIVVELDSAKMLVLGVPVPGGGFQARWTFVSIVIAAVATPPASRMRVGVISPPETRT